MMVNVMILYRLRRTTKVFKSYVPRNLYPSLLIYFLSFFIIIIELNILLFCAADVLCYVALFCTIIFFILFSARNLRNLQNMLYGVCLCLVIASSTVFGSRGKLVTAECVACLVILYGT